MLIRSHNILGTLIVASLSAIPYRSFGEEAPKVPDSPQTSVNSNTVHNFHDHHMLAHMHMMNMHVIRLSQLAIKQAKRSTTKQLAEKMKEEHLDLETKLMNIAANHSFFPGQLVAEMAETPTLRQEHRNLMTTLGKLMGPAFDRGYLQAMVKIHEKECRHIQDRLANIKEQDIRTYFDEAMPLFASHLSESQLLLDQLL